MIWAKLVVSDHWQHRTHKSPTMRKNSVRLLKVDVFDNADASNHFNRIREMQQWIAFEALKNPSLMIKSTISKGLSKNTPNNRFFTTKTRANHEIVGQKRKRKTLLPSSKRKQSTKDRLRLSHRQRKGQESNVEEIMIQSPEELLERLNSRLDIARTVIREGYDSLRESTSSTLLSRNAGTKNENGLLPARQKGTVMDANWWFWNLLFAASPSVMIALYCQFIVKPELKVRNEQKDRVNEETNVNFGDETSDEFKSDKTKTKMSPMRQRQEQRNGHQQQNIDNKYAKNSSSTLSRDGDSNLFEVISSYIHPLMFWQIGSEPQPAQSLENDHNHHSRVEKDKNSSAQENLVKIQGHQTKEKVRIELQQQELMAIKSQLKALEDKIDRQQQQHDAPSASSSWDSVDTKSKSSTEGNSLLSLVGRITNFKMFSFSHWWKGLGHRRQSPNTIDHDLNHDRDDESVPRTRMAIAQNEEKDKRLQNVTRKTSTG